MSRHTQPPVHDTMGMRLAQYAAFIGALMALAGVIALGLTVSLNDEDYPGITHECGNGFGTSGEEFLPDDATEPCAEALSTRRAWAWPLGIAGLVIAGGAVVATSQPRRPAGESAA